MILTIDRFLLVSRSIFELTINQPDLDMPEVIWKAYIDFELSEAEYGHARSLYKRLLDRSSHVKVWIAMAQFELEYSSYSTESKEDGPTALEASRTVFQQAYEVLKAQGLKEERLLLLEAWRDVEAGIPEGGSRSHLEAVEARFPRKIKMSRPVLAEDGVTELGSEDYFDYIFPDDEKKLGTMGALLCHRTGCFMMLSVVVDEYSILYVTTDFYLFLRSGYEDLGEGSSMESSGRSDGYRRPVC